MPDKGDLKKVQEAMAEGPLYCYREAVWEGQYRFDQTQEDAALILQKLFEQLRDQENVVGTLRKKVLSFLHQKSVSEPFIKGVYLFGGVGRGKSMLMDLLAQSFKEKRRLRVHFHEFMQNVHYQLNLLRQDKTINPLAALAKELKRSYDLICFDELHVKDIADAMILAPLFEHLIRSNVRLVITSNRAPCDLYQGGLHRERFESFIRMMEQELVLLSLDGKTDYRRLSILQEKRYFLKKDQESFQNIFKSLVENKVVKPYVLDHQSRQISFDQACHDILYSNFKELCERPLGVQDYLELTKRFDVIFIDHVPVFDENARNEARRFINMIDVFYDQKVTLVLCVEVGADQLYQGKSDRFEFDRTASRLIEMQSWNSKHSF